MSLKVILLNGASSSGKSTLAKSLQNHLKDNKKQELHKKEEVDEILKQIKNAKYVVQEVKKGERTIGYTTQENADYFIQNYHDTELGHNGNNEKLMEAFKAGSESIPNKNYNSIEESAMYEAGKSKTTYDLSLAYLQGAGQANRTVPEREMLDTKKWLNNANEDIIAAYEKGIRDTAFNNDVANQKIEEMLKNKN